MKASFPMRVASKVPVVLFLLLCVACGGPELEFADWFEPLPAPLLKTIFGQLLKKTKKLSRAFMRIIKRV